MKSIYFAGPDIFYPDSEKHFKLLKLLCSDYHFHGLFPDDCNVIHPTADAIRDANLSMIKKADYVLANLNSFRGFEPDSGTVFEIGYAVALGKTVVAYAADRKPMIERLQSYQSLPSGALHDKDGMKVENFGLSHNLMYSHLIKANSPENAIKYLLNL